MDKKNDIIWIEDYLDGELSKDDKELFEEKLKTDKEFARLYYFRKNLKSKLLLAEEYINTRNNVAKALGNTPTINLNPRVLLAIAASVVILLGLYFILNPNFNANNPQIAKVQKTDSLSFADNDFFDTVNDFHNISNYKINSGKLIEIVSIENNELFGIKTKHNLDDMPITHLFFVIDGNRSIDTLYYTGTPNSTIEGTHSYISDTLINDMAYWILKPMAMPKTIKIICMENIFF